MAHKRYLRVSLCVIGLYYLGTLRLVSFISDYED